MLTLFFTVYDSAAGRYLEPFTAPSIDFALRGFREAVNTEGHHFGKFPSDYTLFHIGEFDPETGQMQGMEPRSLGVAITFVDTPQTQIPMDIPKGIADA